MERPVPDFVRCVHCGAVSRLRRHFRALPIGWRVRGPVCAGCRANAEPGVDLLRKMLPWVLAAIVAAAFLAYGFGVALRYVVGFTLLPAGLIVLHELAHAAAGHAAGAHIFEVRVGWGRVYRQWRVRGLRLTLARRPLRGGYCVAAFLHPPVRRWKYAVLYGTPMVLHLLAIVIAAPRLTLPWPGSAIGLLHFFVFWNLLMLLASARPFDYVAGAHAIPNDGRALILLRSRKYAEEWFRRGLILPALYALAEGRVQEARAQVWRVETQFPDDPAVGPALFTAYWALGSHVHALRFAEQFVRACPVPEGDPADLLALGILAEERYERWLRATVCLHGGAYDAALTEVAGALEVEEYDEGRALLLALRGYVRLLAGDSEAALADAGEAFEDLPWIAFVCDTYAAALIETGQPERGLLLLDEADDRDRAERGRPVRNCWRALAEARRGRVRIAERYLRRAQSRGLEVGPPPALVERAERVTAEARSATESQ